MQTNDVCGGGVCLNTRSTENNSATLVEKLFHVNFLSFLYSLFRLFNYHVIQFPFSNMDFNTVGNGDKNIDVML